jgi:peptide/nickel transport system permease protein
MSQDMTAETVDLSPGKSGPAGQNEERVFVATQWQLMWWKFRKHKLAVAGAIFLIVLYITAILADFLAPSDPNAFNKLYPYAPPQLPRFVDENGFHLRPFVYGMSRARDPKTLAVVFEVDKTKQYPISFFVHSYPYKFWGLFETDLHFVGANVDPNDLNQTFYLLGSDRLGRDQLSRILYGTMSFFLGILLGGISGLYGGMIDTVIQRIIEFLRSVPTTPLWMALSAALPPTWPPVRVYFGITIILSFISWTGLARVVRSKFLSLREEDFVMAARIAGTGEMRIIFSHLLPSFLSYIIASLTLSIPGLFIVVTVLSFNFMGDGLRDAADPYMR